MKYQSSNSNSSPWLTLLNQVKRPLVGLAPTVGLLAASFSVILATNLEAPASASFQSSEPGSSLADGTYLYGQSSKPNQLGKTYAVFEVRRGTVVGAFYMPSSSFDCFYGNLRPDKLALTVVDSYERQAYPYAIALERNYPIAAASGTPGISGLKLQGFHQLNTVTENDQRILNTCRADFQQQPQQN